MITEIKQALEKATPGNWIFHNSDSTFSNEVLTDGKPGFDLFQVAGMMTAGDAHLIANAPTWLRWQNERIEQLEKALKIASELVYRIDVAVSEDRLPNIFYGLRRDFREALGKKE